ncbi:MAG: RnfABCDGE type electron transport complex subunit B [Candidatus Zapsychrus exili]|nr:RnfABCDGE type electron transport complex subunit B [Candidatus Zapsychrus exili]
MSNIIIYTIFSLTAVGVSAAVILYLIAQKFKVEEDPKIDEIEEALPAANCGGCGLAGCRAFAEALVKTKDLENFYCPVGGSECMANIAKILGIEAVAKKPTVAVIRCSGSKEHRQKTNVYDSAKTCAISSSVYSGDTGCQYGCLGLGDCVDVCKFNAIYMDQVSQLPIVIDENCTGCGACIAACPKDIIELRNQGPKLRRVFVSCINKDKGGIARKACKVACIGCGKCVKACPFDAITLEDNLAYIDFEKCKLCRKCTLECPTGSIIEANFPPKPVKQEELKEE